MENLKVCRICLVENVFFYKLNSYPLETYYEPLVGHNPLESPELPHYVCYECAALARNCYLFRQKCLRSQSALYGIFNTFGQITLNELRKLDRSKLGLVSRYSNNSLAVSISLPELSNDITIDVPKTDVKEEESEFDSLNKAINDIKEEDIYDSYCEDDLPLPMLSSDEDDEPLALHKKHKEEIIEKKKCRKIKKKTQFVDENVEYMQLEDFDSVQTNINKILSLEIGKIDKPRKRGRPPKNKPVKAEQKFNNRRTKNTGGVLDDIDIEHYVTIIRLTVEEQMEEIEKRKLSSNYLNAPFKCEFCFKGFINNEAWTHHINKHHPSAGDVICAVCKLRFLNKRVLQKHMINHEKKYACKTCDYVSKTTTQAKQHQRWHKGVTYKCQYCDEESSKWTSYLSHVRMKHPSEFICGICGYSFVSKLGLSMHKTMMHKDVLERDSIFTGPFCKECDVQFISLEAYKRHMVTSAKHIKSDNFKTGCRVCGETFESAEDLRQHHRKLHARKRPINYGKRPSDISWPTKCMHCSVTITNAREYWAHFRRVHPDKDYPIKKDYICDVCGKSFRANAFLVYHKRTHSTERAFKCAQCPKAFFNRGNLQIHEKTHSDNRPYPCTVCCKGFKSKGALDRHFRTHTGSKPYECEVCGKAFGQSNSRKLHVMTVHLKQPAPYVSRARLEKKRVKTQPIDDSSFMLFNNKLP